MPSLNCGSIGIRYKEGQRPYYDLVEMGKPKVLICATSVYGQVMPMRAIAKGIISRGYDVTFVTGSDYAQAIEDIGSTFVPLTGASNNTEARLTEIRSIEKWNPRRHGGNWQTSIH